MQPNGPAALARLASRSQVTPGMCLWYCQDAWQVPHDYASAAAQWAATEQHTDLTPMQIPDGAPVFWTGGSSGYGHIALWSKTHQGILSTDQLAQGQTAFVNIAHIGQVWGLRLVGWGGSLGGERLALSTPAAYTPPPPVRGGLPHVSLVNVRAEILRDGPAPQGYASNKANGLPVEQALAQLGLLAPGLVDGSLGGATFGSNSAYQRWQVRLGFRGAAADGYPPTVLTGSDSFSRLASSTRRFIPVP